jgi:hypothetical protein
MTGVASNVTLSTGSLEYGSNSKLRMLRIGAQSDWPWRWFESNQRHLGGYWDGSLALWRASAHQGIPGRHQNIVNLGLTPVFRYQANERKSWYVEAGIGLNLLSERYDNDSNKLSTKLQFGDHIGAGYVFDNQWEAGIKIQHFSNGGFRRPNGGANFFVIKLSRRF